MKKLYVYVSPNQQGNLNAHIFHDKPKDITSKEHSTLKSHDYEVHLYSHIKYKKTEAEDLVEEILTDPITRTRLVGEIFPLDTDTCWDSIFILDNSAKSTYILVRGRVSGINLEVDAEPVIWIKEEYPLDLTLKIYRTLGFEIHEIGKSKTEVHYVIVHPSAKVDWQNVAMGFRQWVLGAIEEEIKRN